MEIYSNPVYSFLAFSKDKKGLLHNFTSLDFIFKISVNFSFLHPKSITFALGLRSKSSKILRSEIFLS